MPAMYLCSSARVEMDSASGTGLAVIVGAYHAINSGKQQQRILQRRQSFNSTEDMTISQSVFSTGVSI